jgi:hypothetical protein
LAYPYYSTAAISDSAQPTVQVRTSIVLYLLPKEKQRLYQPTLAKKDRKRLVVLPYSAQHKGLF